MSKRYEFDFSRFSIGHLAALLGPNEAFRLGAIHDLTVGGIYHLSMAEYETVLAQFATDYAAFAARVKADLAVDAAGDDAVVRGMLDGIEGL